MDVDVDADPPLDLLALPNETLNTIFVYLSPSSLVALIRCCRRLQSVCERLLYSNIDIEENVDDDFRDPNALVTPVKTDGCCTAVRRRPHLATGVKRISIRWTRSRRNGHRNGQPEHPLRLAPGTMSALKCLLHMAASTTTLILYLAGFRGSYREVLDQCTFRLRSLSLGGRVAAPGVHSFEVGASSDIEWFLQHQPNIMHLHLPDTHRELRLRSGVDLPFLASFRGDARAAASLLPGRPVRALALSGSEPSEAALIACGLARNPIRSLDLAGLAVTPTQLLTISKHLTAPETLRIRLALRHTLHFTFSGMVCCERIF